jgi:hypothetical protein
MLEIRKLKKILEGWIGWHFSIYIVIFTSYSPWKDPEFHENARGFG